MGAVRRATAVVALIASASWAGASTATIPPGGIEAAWWGDDGPPVFEVTIGGKGPYRFALDTGASGDGRITRTLASALGLPIVGKVTMGDPSGRNTVEGNLHRVVSLELAGAAFRELDLAARPDDVPEPWAEGGVEGVLGMDLFRGALLTLDYPSRRLRLAEGALPEADGRDVLALSLRHGIPRVRLALGDLSFDADIDAGSPGGLYLPEDLAARVAWVRPPRVVGKVRTAFNEAELRAGLARGTLSLGGVVLTDPEVETGPLLPHAHLGARLLSRYRVTFDTANGRVRFEPGPQAAAGPPPRKGYGVLLRRDDPAAIVVEDVVPGSSAQEAGLRSGDRIVALDGQPVAKVPEGGVPEAFRRPTLTLTVERDGARRDVRLDARELAPGALKRRFDRYPSWTDLPDLLAQVRRETGTPAMAVAVVRDGAIAAHAVSGRREQGKDAPVTLADRWHAGSSAKPMTATLVALLVEEGRLGWGSTLGDLLPDVAMRPEYRSVTVDEVLRHRGGLPQVMNVSREQVTKYTALGEGRAQRAGFVADLLQMPPGTRGSFAYSNGGYALLGHVAERHAGRPWEDLIVERVFRPLGMTSSGIGWPATPDRPDQPRGHFETEDGLRVQGLDEYDLGRFLAPAGNVHASIDDLARFAAFHLAGLQGKDGLLKAATVARLHATPDLAPGEEPYAAGWEVVPEWTDEPFHGHGGSAGTFHCQVALWPKAGLAVVAADNRGGEDEPSPAMQAVLAVARKEGR